MNKANELAQRWVKPPKKDGADWVVEWLSGAKVIRSISITAEDAYAFYYSKIKFLSQKITNNSK